MAGIRRVSSGANGGIVADWMGGVVAKLIAARLSYDEKA